MSHEAVAIDIDTPTQDRPRVRFMPLGSLQLAGSLLFAVAIALFLLLHTASNYQERYDVLQARQTFNSIYKYGSPDNPMPLYYMLIHALYTWLGAINLIILRILSLGFYGLVVVVTYLAAKLATGNREAAYFGAALVSLSPFLVWYAGRGTEYSLLALIVLINQVFFVAAFQRKWWAYAGYLVSGALGLGVHYFFAVVILTQLAFLIVKRRDFGRRGFILIGVSALVLLAAFGAWIGISARHNDFWNSLPYTSRPSATNTFIIFVQYLFGFQSVVVTTLIIAFWPLLVMFALLAIQKYIRPPVGIQYFFISAVLPVIAIFALSWAWKPLFLSSYLIIGLPAFIICTAWYLTAYKLRSLAIGRAVLVGVMAIMLLTEAGNWHIAWREDYLGVLQRAVTGPTGSIQTLPTGVLRQH